MLQNIARKIVVYIGALVLLAWTLVPIYWMINMSLMYKSELMSVPAHLYPEQPTPANYLRLFDLPAHGPTGAPMEQLGQADLIRAGWANSLKVAIPVTILSLIIALPVAYALGRLQFKGKLALLFGLISTRAYPPIAVLIPFMYLFLVTGLRGTTLGLIIIYLTISVPLISWVMSGFFQSLPRNLEQLARTDGLTRMQTFIRVMLPMSTSGVVASAVIGFLVAWNEFTFSLILATGSPAQTFPPALAGLFFQISEPTDMAAASFIGILPPAILALVFQSRLRRLNLVNPL